MNKLEQAARQALEALIKTNHFHDYEDEITALRSALADSAASSSEALAVSEQRTEEQAEQEPYAYEIDLIMEGVDKVGYPLLTSDKTAIERLSGNKNYSLKPLYAAPVRTKDLTVSELDAIIEKHYDDEMDLKAMILDGIAADREKNK